eukprot:m.45333 g.45333  ORF g.45333 m.45333 type:complete len:76 (-) comp11773_c0_seq1:1013-1240(-)
MAPTRSTFPPSARNMPKTGSSWSREYATHDPLVQPIIHITRVNPAPPVPALSDDDMAQKFVTGMDWFCSACSAWC